MTRFRQAPQGSTDDTFVHVEGSSICGTETLCGHVDTFIPWGEHPGPATCPGCLDVVRVVRSLEPEPRRKVFMDVSFPMVGSLTGSNGKKFDALNAHLSAAYGEPVIAAWISSGKQISRIVRHQTRLMVLFCASWEVARQAFWYADRCGVRVGSLVFRAEGLWRPGAWEPVKPELAALIREANRDMSNNRTEPT